MRLLQHPSVGFSGLGGCRKSLDGRRGKAGMFLVRRAVALLSPRAVTHSLWNNGWKSDDDIPTSLVISHGRNAKLLLRIHRIPPLNVPMPQYRIIFRFQFPPEPSSTFMHIHLWQFRTEVKGRRLMRLGCYPETRMKPSRFPMFNP